MKRIVISGGAGFIGSHLTKKLLESGNHVIVLDNLLTGNRENIKQFEGNNQFVFIEHDVTKTLESIESYLNEVDEIYHLASPASPNKNSKRSYIAYPIETLLVNSIGTYNLLQLARSKNSKLLYASSSEVYGDPELSPQPESYNGNVSPNGIRSVYDEGKRFGEAMTMGFYRKYGVDTRIIRIFNTFGPQMMPDDGRVVSNFIVQALQGEDLTIYGEGKQTRSFCFVSDMVEGIVKAMESDGTSGDVFNLGNPDERTISEVATMIKEVVGSDSLIVHKELPEDDPTRRKPDIEKARKKLNWEPKVSFEDGLALTIEYFRRIISK